jgi:hypothetical protein
VLFGTGLISNGLNPVPIEEQPVVKTTAIPSTPANNAARPMWFKKAPEQWSVSNLPLLEGQINCAMC